MYHAVSSIQTLNTPTEHSSNLLLKCDKKETLGYNQLYDDFAGYTAGHDMSVIA